MKRIARLIVALATVALLLQGIGGVTVNAAGGVPITANTFPDANFRAIIQSSTYDKNGDKYLSADEISKIGNVNFETVLTMRYIDGKSWDEIAERMDLRIRTVLKFHGHGLVRMAEVLVRDGLIDPDDLNGQNGNTQNGQMENEREENAAE